MAVSSLAGSISSNFAFVGKVWQFSALNISLCFFLAMQLFNLSNVKLTLSKILLNIQMRGVVVIKEVNTSFLKISTCYEIFLGPHVDESHFKWRKGHPGICPSRNKRYFPVLFLYFQSLFIKTFFLSVYYYTELSNFICVFIQQIFPKLLYRIVNRCWISCLQD